jgi:glycosyltransferase involved in cell wall biosynthesis
MVDDGSSDTSGQICDEYAAKYKFFRVFHQKNQGQSASRNYGTKMATGDLVTYIDSDDIVMLDYVEYLKDLMKRYDADIAVAGSVYQYDNKPLRVCCKETISECLSPLEAIRRMCYNQRTSTVVWAKMYKKYLLLQNPFPEGRIYEDVVNIPKIIGDAKRIAVGNQQVYYWIQRSGSTVHESFRERQYDGITAVSELLEYVKHRYPEAEEAAKFRYSLMCVKLLASCFHSGVGHREFKRLRDYAAPYTWDVVRDTDARLSVKIRLIAIRLGYLSSKFVFGIHENMKQGLV